MIADRKLNFVISVPVPGSGSGSDDEDDDDQPSGHTERISPSVR